MATRVDQQLPTAKGEQQGTEHAEKRIGCSIGIMAYNEEANIARTLKAVLAQQ